MEKYRRPAANRTRARTTLRRVLASIAAGHFFSNGQENKKAMTTTKITLAAILAAATLLLTSRDEPIDIQVPTFSTDRSCSPDSCETTEDLDEIEIAPLVPSNFDRRGQNPAAATGHRDRRDQANNHDAKPSFFKRLIERIKERRAERKEKRKHRRDTRREKRRAKRTRH